MSGWRKSVRAKMVEVYATYGPEGEAQTKQLVGCLAAGVDRLTAGVYGIRFWAQELNKDRPDAGAAAAAFSRKLRRVSSPLTLDVSRQPKMVIDPQMTSCSDQGGTWDPASGYCVVPEDDIGAGAATMEGDCVDAGGSWDSTSHICDLSASDEPGSGKTGLYLALGGLGIIVLTGAGIYLARR
jgi:hypothetical protein